MPEENDPPMDFFESGLTDDDFLPDKVYEADVVLDQGVCGEHVVWTLYQSGLLELSGYGRCYDYIKGALENYDREYIENEVAEGRWPIYYGFRDDATYDVEHQQWVSPWYRYRAEVDFENYMPRSLYDKFNPNGWTYHYVRIDPRITYLGDWMFYRCCVSTLMIPEGVEELGIWCIRYSPTMEKLSLPSSLRKIGDYGVSRNIAMTAVRIQEGVVEMGEYAFTQNSALISVKFPNSLKKIGRNLFEGADLLEKCSLGNVEVIPERCFVCNSYLSAVKIPSCVTLIENYAFAYCSELTIVYVPENVKEIGKLSFYGCGKLNTVFLASKYIARTLKEPYEWGFLLNAAKVIYLRDDVAPQGYISSFRKVTTDRKGWKKYVKI